MIFKGQKIEPMADLLEANLYMANLREANLFGANLYGADLRGANLRGANLREANLYGADLRWVDLADTCLDPNATMPDLDDSEITDAGLEISGDRVCGWRTARSMHCGDTKYAPGRCYEAPVFSVDTASECHPGIYLASRELLERMYSGACLVRCYCLRSELVHAADKWRCKRLWVVEAEDAS